MQYLGSRRNVAGFSAGMAGGVFLVHLFLAWLDDSEILIEAGVAAVTVFAGTLVGTLVWSSVGRWLRTRRTPSLTASAGVGGALAFALMGVITLGVHRYFSFDIPHEVAFWFSVSLWNAIGYGLAIAPSGAS